MERTGKIGPPFTTTLAPMRLVALVLLCLLWSSCAIGQSARVCPTLPADAQLQWSYSQGPDFDICRASRGKQLVFGLYMGNHPNFHPDERQRAEKGVIGGFEVVWYNVPSNDAARPIARATLLPLGLRRSSEILHFWAFAENLDELQRTFSILQRIQFR